MTERVFITGASDGIGAALAKRYAARGATVGLVARRADKLEALAATLPTSASIHIADVGDSAALAAAAEAFMQRHGVPDVVIANAGVSAGAAIGEPDAIDTLAWILDINVVGVARTLQPFVAPMRTAKRGTLVGIASVAGIRGLPGAGAYSASKAAVISVLESLRVELRGSGVRVVTLLPGYIATAMTARNPYRMPFILDADEAARRFVRVIDSGRAYAVVPWQMALVAKLLRALPDALYDRAFAGAKRKPSRKELGL
jgi:short-subunit dehydrogenase